MIGASSIVLAGAQHGTRGIIANGHVAAAASQAVADMSAVANATPIGGNCTPPPFALLLLTRCATTESRSVEAGALHTDSSEQSSADADAGRASEADSETTNALPVPPESAQTE